MRYNQRRRVQIKIKWMLTCACGRKHVVYKGRVVNCPCGRTYRF